MDREKLNMALEFITQMNPEDRKTLAHILGQEFSAIPQKINIEKIRNVRDNKKAKSIDFIEPTRERSGSGGATGQRVVVDPTNIQVRLGK